MSFVNLADSNTVAADFSEVSADTLMAWDCNLYSAKFTGANLPSAIFWRSNLGEADLSGANLREADLSEAILVRTKVEGAKISGSRIYGINAWELDGEFEDQKDLIITKKYKGEDVTVDNIKIAGFIHSILMADRPVRFTLLDAIGKELRAYGL